jgi:hypothetical protein
MEHTESLLEYALLGVETVFPFTVAEKSIVRIQPRTDSVGFLEVNAIEGAPLFVWRGNKTAKECEETLENELGTFDVAAAIGQKGVIKVEPGVSQLTVFSNKLSIGYIRVREFPGC